MTEKTKIDWSRGTRHKVKRRRHSTPTPDVVAAPPPPAPKLYFGLSLRHWAYLYVFFAATVITWVTSQSVTQFNDYGPVAFQDGFPGDLSQWTKRGSPENVLLEQDSVKVQREIDNIGTALRTFDLEPSNNRAQEKLAVSGYVETIKKKLDTDQSAGGAVMVRLRDENDEVLNHIVIARLDGLSDHYNVSRVVNLTENITSFSILLTNKKSSAEFALLDASVSLVSERPTFHNARVVIFFLWSVLLLFTLYYLFTQASKAMFAVIATVISLTVIGVLMPENIRTGAIKPVYKTIQNVTGLSGDIGLMYAYKFGHFIFFFLSTLILLLYRKALELLAWEIFILMVLFAIATEGMQLYLLDRSTRFTDLIIDISAIFVGAMLAAIIIAIRAIRSNKTKPPPATPQP